MNIFRKIILFMVFPYFQILTFVSIVLRLTKTFVKILRSDHGLTVCARSGTLGSWGPCCFGRLRVNTFKTLNKLPPIHPYLYFDIFFKNSHLLQQNLEEKSEFRIFQVSSLPSHFVGLCTIGTAA